MSSTSVPSPTAEVFVLDSWAFAEQLSKEVLLPRLTELIEASERSEVRLLFSEMNLGELFYLVAKRRGEARADAVLHTIRQLPIHIVPVSSAGVLHAARLKARHTISYADAFCAALAVTHSAPVVTGDPDFLKLQQEGILRVDWIGA